METRFVRVVHGSDSHFVALYSGLSPVELSRLLKIRNQTLQASARVVDRAQQGIMYRVDRTLYTILPI
eukprot:9101-Heterococcus_DN1.PRE.3